MAGKSDPIIRPTKMISRNLVPQIFEQYSDYIAKQVISELNFSSDIKEEIYNKYKEELPLIITNNRLNQIYRYLQNHNGR